ncbi:MAG TPA: NYN domain-containing protein [Longimicrobium sp.]|jgi:uncharacterized LabA/DUF88 family protein
MRVAFIIDGFNLYHSIRDAEKQVSARPQRWLNLRTFCEDYVRHFGPTAVLSGVFYFSALAKHLEAAKPDIVRRHQSYIEAIEATGVDVTLASFKSSEKFIPFKYCEFRLWPIRRRIRLPIPRWGVVVRRTEEKETDVAIASKMFELLHTSVADAIVLVSGDTDLLPAIRMAKSLFPGAEVAVIFPFKRHNAELKRVVRRSFKVRREQYARHQLPDPIVLPNGHQIRKPQTW